MKTMKKTADDWRKDVEAHFAKVGEDVGGEPVDVLWRTLLAVERRWEREGRSRARSLAFDKTARRLIDSYERAFYRERAQVLGLGR